MFARGNWAIFGVTPGSLDTFKNHLNDDLLMLQLAQISAHISTKMTQKDAWGLNPFNEPRVDETLLVGGDALTLEAAELVTKLDQFNRSNEEEKLAQPLNLVPYMDFFGSGAEEFQLGEDGNTFGFWFVMNQWKDLQDAKSKKEGLSYTHVSRPYPFLNKEEKKSVDAQVAVTNAVQRKQFPVLVDFSEGRVYVETTAPAEIELVQQFLSLLGAEVEGIRWVFGDANWPQKFLKNLADNTHFRGEFNKRAEELTRFRKDAVEKLEDKVMERIVSTFFTLTELPNALWAGMVPGAQVKLHETSDPIAVTTPSNAVMLLNTGDATRVHMAQVIFQELTTRYSKTKGEIVVRNDQFRLEVSENTNLQDVGAALLRGFDLPQYRKEIIREIKKTKSELTIAHYWAEWLRQMRGAVWTFRSCVCETLEIPENSGYGLQVYEKLGEAEEEVSI